MDFIFTVLVIAGFYNTFTILFNLHVNMSETVLQLKNVSIYQGDSMVLSDVNFEMNKGDFVYLIGKTGSGKSSFMKTLYGDLQLTEGEGHVVDYNLRTMHEKDIPFLRRKLGIVFQDFKLLPDRTINSNLEFVLKATGWKDKTKIKERIETVLGKVAMKTKGFKFPHELSGGEQQRIAIARALLNDPELILADEPTGNLDPQTSIEVMEVLRDINKNGNTILMATHDYALLLKYPSKTLKCDENKVFEVVQRKG
ncbi:MAG: cell division transport system ATP-binding protein [Psychroserpens sp.]|jgi:cell division transport system ATP-binding protein